jgi:hypothetical protein
MGLSSVTGYFDVDLSIYAKDHIVPSVLDFREAAAGQSGDWRSREDAFR